MTVRIGYLPTHKDGVKLNKNDITFTELPPTDYLSPSTIPVNTSASTSTLVPKTTTGTVSSLVPNIPSLPAIPSIGGGYANIAGVHNYLSLPKLGNITYDHDSMHSKAVNVLFPKYDVNDPSTWNENVLNSINTFNRHVPYDTEFSNWVNVNNNMNKGYMTPETVRRVTAYRQLSEGKPVVPTSNGNTLLNTITNYMPAVGSFIDKTKAFGVKAADAADKTAGEVGNHLKALSTADKLNFGLQAIGSVMGIMNQRQANKMTKQALNFSREYYKKDYEMRKKQYNMSLEDRQAYRQAYYNANGGAKPLSVNEYLRKYGA